MSTKAIIVLLSTFLVLVVSAGCREGDRITPFIIVVDWDVGHDIAEDRPRMLLGGRLLHQYPDDPEQPMAFGPQTREIGGLQYGGFAAWHVEGPGGTVDPRPGLLAMEAFARRLSAPYPLIDIRVLCTVQCEFRLENFDKGILRDMTTGEQVTAPYLLTPGKYHLQASME